MKIKHFLAIGLLLLVLAFAQGCTETERARRFSTNAFKPYTVVQFSGGKEIGRWTTRNRPMSESDSDGFTFVDSKTNKLYLVSGDVQIIEE